MNRFKKLLFVPILLLPTIFIASCSSNSITNNKETSKDNVSENLTKEQILYINSNNAKTYIKKFPELLSSHGVLDLSIFENLNSINENAFVGISNIKKIIFNKKITEIRNGAFKNIASLTELEIPNSLKIIGENSFHNAFLNSDVIVNFNHNEVISEIGRNAFGTSGVRFILHNETIKQLLISSGVQASDLISSEDPIGGFFSNLNVDKYLSIISVLKIDEKTILSSLTNDNLNSQLKAYFPSKNYSVTILSGSSEYNGILELNLILNKNNNLPIKVKVSGFNSFKKDEKYIISKILINSNLWFKDFQKEEMIRNWTLENWKKYLSTLEISDFYFKKTFNLLSIGNNVNYLIKFENKKVSIDLEVNYKKFDGSNWSQEYSNKIQIGGKSSSTYNLELPGKNELYDFIKNILEIKEMNKVEYIEERYASYFLHASKSISNDFLNNILEIPKKYLSYVKENLNLNDKDGISLRFNNIYPNDTTGVLRFTYSFIDLSNNEKQLFAGSYQISNFKVFNQNNLSASMKIIKGDSSLFSTYLKRIKSILGKDGWNNISENSNISLINFGFIGRVNIQNIHLLYDGDEQDENSKTKEFDLLKKSFSLLLNNLLIGDDSIDLRTNYFYDKNNSNEGVVLKYLFIETNTMNNAKISKSNNVFVYSFPIKISFGISNSNNFYDDNVKDISINTNCVMTINQEDIK